MIREAIEYLVNLGSGEVLELAGDDRRFWSRPGANPIPMVPPHPDALKFSSLTGLVKYINLDPDNIFRRQGRGIVHVEGPARVSYKTCADNPYLQRDTYAEAITTIDDKLVAGLTTRLSQMVPYLGTGYAHSKSKDELADLLSNIVVSNEVQFVDNGLSQQVTVKKGVATIMHVAVPREIDLRPLGGFPDINLPEMTYLVRLSRGVEEPTVHLSWVRDPSWELRYMERITAFLVERINADLAEVLL